MPTLSTELDRFVRFALFAVREDDRDVIVAKPLDPTVQEEMAQQARLAGVIGENETIDDLYKVFSNAGFHEEIVEEASKRRPMLVREHTEAKGENHERQH